MRGHNIPFGQDCPICGQLDVNGAWVSLPYHLSKKLKKQDARVCYTCSMRLKAGDIVEMKDKGEL